MADESYSDILAAEGFQAIGSVSYGFPLSLWWHPELHLELSLVHLGKWTVVRGTKSYYLRAWGADGELYARDLPALQSFLTTHFEEMHLQFSFVRDITPGMVRRRIKEKKFSKNGSEPAHPETLQAELTQLADEFSVRQSTLKRDEDLKHLNRGQSPLIQRHLQQQMAASRHQLNQIRQQAKSTRQQLSSQRQLEKEYLRKGRANCLLFTLCSNIQILDDRSIFEDVVHYVVKELQDMHSFQIRQKLQGGKLQIYIDEIDSPSMSLYTRWTGAALNPRQLPQDDPELVRFCEEAQQQYMILPEHDILLGGAIQDQKKLVAARVVRTLLERLDKVPAHSIQASKSPSSCLPVWIGVTEDGSGRLGNPWELPLDKTNHIFLSGKTGSGKSFAGFVIVEGVLSYEKIAVIVLDPRGQWIGLLCPEDRSHILNCYPKFGMETNQARGFGFAYHGVGQNWGQPLPEKLGQLAKGRHIVSFKGMDDRARCNLAADIIDAVFDTCAVSEASQPRVFLVIEEVHRFIRKGIGREARVAAERTEQSIDRVTREGRKYGLNLMLIGQSSRDISHTMATIRQNISTRIFLANSDREVEYAHDYLGNGNAIMSLAPGQAYICNPEWGSVRVALRPPLSKVWEPDESEVRRILGMDQNHQSQILLSDMAQAVLDESHKEYSKLEQPVRLSLITGKLGITSRRKIQEIVAELQKASAARFEQLPGRGRPLVIVPVEEVD